MQVAQVLARELRLQLEVIEIDRHRQRAVQVSPRRRLRV
jgi:hypothetical protein